jgi:glycosyltransferase involved in cell wall biosynthesis
MDALVEELSRADVFLYPSYHHGLATVVLQAMLTGLPVVCLEGDATGRIIGSECGVTVSLNRGTDFIRGLSDALSRLYEDEVLRVTLARRARERAANNYSYQAIVAGYHDVYTKLVGSKL